MPRKGSVPKRDVLPDPIHNSKLATKLINKIMLDGKRGTAQGILYNAFELVQERSGRDALEVFEEAIENIMPVLEVKARRVGGSNYQVPVEVRPERRTTLGLRWLVTTVCGDMCVSDHHKRGDYSWARAVHMAGTENIQISIRLTFDITVFVFQ